VLVFVRTKHGADRVARFLSGSGVHAQAIHGDKSQGARQSALSNFKAGKTKVLIATDIAARGIDVDKLSYVINFEIPNIAETYVHRIGRTGRAGEHGVALSFCDDDEKPFVRDIQKLIKKEIPVGVHPFATTSTQTSSKSATVAPAQVKRDSGNGNPTGKKNRRFFGNRKTSSARR
jgi:ATP-dependent RNA helicase RhlE